MQIETYEIEEIKSSEASMMAADSEAIDIINKLELDGQQELVNPETATRFQYPALTKQQKVILKALFPEATTLKSYSDSIVPLRVLQVAAFCRDFKQTKHLEVWHSGTAKEDPVLIGRAEAYSGTEYLLARWGDSLKTFDELKALAVPRIEAELRVACEKAKAKLDAFVAAISDHAKLAVERGSHSIPSVWNVD